MSNEHTLKTKDYVRFYRNNDTGECWFAMPYDTSDPPGSLRGDNVVVEHLSVEYLISTGLRVHRASKDEHYDRLLRRRRYRASEPTATAKENTP